MCLDKIRSKVDDPAGTILSGWKEFRKFANTLEFQNQGFKGSKYVPLDQWIEAESVKLGSFTSKYKSGFHVYSDEVEIKPAASGGRYYRVYYRQVETVGEQNGHTVVIARWMYVPSNPDAWPPLRS